MVKRVLVVSNTGKRLVALNIISMFCTEQTGVTVTLDIHGRYSVSLNLLPGIVADVFCYYLQSFQETARKIP
jgi:hypothetical protein